MSRVASIALVAAAFTAPAPVLAASNELAVSVQETAVSPSHAVCIPVIVETDDGPVGGILCIPQNGQL